MHFRPCIDIHEGAVKQIVGATLNENGAQENFVSKKNAEVFAGLFKEHELTGGHVIILDRPGTEAYEASKYQAIRALSTFPKGLMIGGGITDYNAGEYLFAGASHVIMTSYLFHDGILDMERLHEIATVRGASSIVLDLSCKKKDGAYFVATDRWTKLTEQKVTPELFEKLSGYCAEFLIHAADVEGRRAGVDEELIGILSEWEKNPITYAGGVGSLEDVERVKKAGKGRVDLTVGSAMDFYGGSLSLKEVLRIMDHKKNTGKVSLF